MEPFPDAPENAPAHGQNTVNKLRVDRWGVPQNTVPPPGPEHQAELARAREERHQRSRPVHAVHAPSLASLKQTLFPWTKGAARQEEGPKPSVLKHRLPALTASGHEDDPGLTAPTQTLEVPTEPPRRPVRPVSPGRNRPAAIHEDIDQEYQYIDFPEEAPTRSVLRHPLPALTTSRHEDNPSLAAPIETLEAPTEPSRLPVRPVSPGGKRPVAIHEDIDQEYAYFDLAEEAPNRSVPRHQLPALTSSRHEDNPGCTAPIEALDAPIEAPLEAPIEPPRRPGEPGKTSRKRQAAQFKDHNQDSKSLIKSTRSPVEYESATARDSQDQVSDSFEEYCTGNGQTLEQEPAFVLHRTVSAERISSRPGRSPRQAFHSRSPVHSQDSFALPSIPVAASEYNLPADHPIENTEVVELRRSNLPQRTSSLSEDTPRRASAGHSSEASSIPFAFDEAHILDDDPILEIINLHERQRSDSSSKPSSLSEENPRRESDSQSLAAPLNPFVSDEDQFSGDDKVLENIDLVSTRGSNALSTSSSLLVECSKTTLVSPAVTSTPVDSVENDFPGDHQILESFAPVRTRRASLPSILPSFLVEHSPTTLVSPAVTPTPVDSVENDFPGDHQILENFDLVRTRRARLTSRESIVREANSRRASGNPSHASSVYSQDPIEYHILENLDLVRTRRASLPSRESSFCAENSQRASNNLSHASSVYSQDPIEHQSVQSFDVVRTRRTSLPSRETISCVENTHRVSDNPSHASSVYSQDPIEHQNLQNFDLARTRRTSLPSRETIFCEENAHRVSDNPSHASSVYFQDPIETSHTSSQPLDTHSSSELVPAALVATQSSLEVNMENTRASVFLDPVTAQDNVMTSQKLAAIKIAKEQEQAIHEKLRRNGHDIPKYEFQELIGKGAYGRVFKSFDQEHNRVVALKVIDVDTTDYKVNARAKDDTIDDTVHEIKVLSQLKDSKAKNVNTMFDAFQVHSQLWIVNDYCPGGSVHTLMRATGNKLEEKYIVPIARELAVALKAVHAAGIIHRDVKSANVMIHENGSLQVIDFGVAGVLQTKVDKRSTVIGTPHWMPPELHKLAPPAGLTYGTEIDVWAYGCTLYEIATGYPPNAGMEPGRRLGATLGRNAPRLDHAIFSEGLCALVAFVLEPKPADRPSMEAVLEQEYIANTEETHPTTSLAELVKTYYRWERSGGHRHSLFFAGGAPAAEFPETLDNEGSWNFSLTENFEQHIVDSENLTETSSLTPAVNAEQAADSSFESYPLSPTPAVFTPATSPRVPIEMSTSSETPRVTDETSTETTEKEAYIEERVKRGEQAMQGLFDENKDSYKYEVKNDFVQQRARHPVSRLRSDLPLRHETEQSSLSHNELEVRARNLDTDSMPNIDLANVNTIKANRMHRFVRDFGGEGETNEPQYGNYGVKRETMDLGWSFPQGLLATTTTATTTGTEGSVEPTERPTVASPLPAPILVVPPVPAPTLVVPPQPRLQRANTAPVHHVGADSRQSVIDLDELYDSDALSMAPTLRAPPTAAAAAAAAADPVQQESDVETEENKSTTSTDGSLAFDYGPTHAEISEHSTTSSDNEVSSGDDYHPSPPPPLHHLVLQESSPPSAAAMREGAPAAVVEAEVTRLLEEWNASLGVLAQAFAGAGDESHVGGGEEGGEETGGEGRNGEGEE